MNWILLILSLPSDNATARTRIWRTLKSLGCGTLRDGAWLLPQREDLETILRHQAEEARTAGGNAWLLSMGGQGEADRDLAALFDRGPEYAALDQALDRLADPAQDGGQDAPTLKKLLRGLRRQFEQLAAIDYFPGPARQASEARLERVARLVRARINPGEPGARDARIERLDPADYRGRLWATRRDLWVDRLASAWLIRRRIDPAARFLWLDHPAECPDAALGFDFDGATFSHVVSAAGERVSFETLLASFDLEGDAALARIGAIVHSLDLGANLAGAAPEAAGLEAVLKGLKARIADDDQLLAEGGRLLDDLYAAFADKNGELT
jgi:hypothetical protein